VDVSRLAPAAGANDVVWNLKPYFGEKPSPAVQAWYAARFPNSALVDAFEVRWR
jgi:hypothetical protein